MMLKKKINPGYLKTKYVLGVHDKLPHYPDAEDIIFELIRDYCGKVAKDIKFTDVSLQKKWNLTEEQSTRIISTLLSQGILEEVYGNSAYKTYEVIINPFI